MFDQIQSNGFFEQFKPRVKTANDVSSTTPYIEDPISSLESTDNSDIFGKLINIGFGG